MRYQASPAICLLRMRPSCRVKSRVNRLAMDLDHQRTWLPVMGQARGPNWRTAPCESRQRRRFQRAVAVIILVSHPLYKTRRLKVISIFFPLQLTSSPEIRRCSKVRPRDQWPSIEVLNPRQRMSKSLFAEASFIAYFLFSWDANNAQQTLPSIPMITDDDDFGLRAALHNGSQANTSGSSTGSAVGHSDYGSASSSSHMGKQRQAPHHGHAKRQQRSSPPMVQQQPNFGRNSYNGGNNYAQQQQHEQQRPSPYGHGNSMPMDLDSSRDHELTSKSVAHAAAVLEQVSSYK